MRPDISQVVEEMSFIEKFFPSTQDDPLPFMDGKVNIKKQITKIDYKIILFQTIWIRTPTPRRRCSTRLRAR